ncbi:MAG TPA: RidA family protein [Ktedonobacteraceae bacterium]
MQRTKIQTSEAPAAIGPYSQAIRVGQFLYASGQVALDPASGEIIGTNVQEQAERVFQNMQAVLASAGASLASIVKTTVFLANMSDFQAMNAVYARYFADVSGPLPARSTVAVAELPRKALVEIEYIAVLDE